MRTSNDELTLAQARDICAHVATQKIRWGRQYDGSEVGVDTLMDALIVLAKESNHADTDMKEALTKANRQLGAANARETKLKNRVAELETLLNV